MGETKEFDEYAKDYRTIHTQNVQKISGEDSDYFSEYKIKEIFDRKLVEEKSTWLDLGCGDGNTARFVKKFYPRCKYCGIDVSEESIEMAKKNMNVLEGDMSYKSYDGTTIPYENETFDVVFIACVLHHVLPEKREALLGECFRVLKNKGIIVIFEHNPYNPLTRRMVDTCPFDVNAQLLSASYLKRLLEKREYQNCRKRYTIFFPRKNVFRRLLMIEAKLFWLPLGGQYYCVAKKERSQ